MPAKNRKPVPEDALNQMQWYLGEETVEDYQDGIISRRAMLKRLIIICGGSAAAATVLAACGVPPAALPAATSATSAPSPTDAPTSQPTSTAQAEPTATTAATATTESATQAPAATASPAATSATTGGSMAVLSVAADDPDVQSSDVTYQSDTEILAYLARPAADGTYPGVIVIHENRGLTDHIKDVARRLAKAGFVALAPDLVSRNGGTAANSRDQVAGLLGQSNPDDLVKDLNAGVDFLLQQTGVNPDKAGVVGFCFGGAYTLRLAAANPKIAAAVPYYGVTPQPAEQLANTNAAIMGQYGANDARVNNTIPALEETLTNAGKTFEKHIYEGAGHAFNNDTGANYNEAAATQAWQRTLDWFTQYLN
jgi:carboxymethylenebutenolidase